MCPVRAIPSEKEVRHPQQPTERRPRCPIIETEGDDRVAEHLLDGLEQDLRIDRLALSRKEPLLDRALIFLALALALELTGVVG